MVFCVYVVKSSYASFPLSKSDIAKYRVVLVSMSLFPLSESESDSDSDVTITKLLDCVNFLAM